VSVTDTESDRLVHTLAPEYNSKHQLLILSAGNS